MYKAVIFDLDGTLLNTLDDLYNAVNYALKEFSFPVRTKEEVRKFIGNGVRKLMERSTPDGTDENTQESCLNCFRSYYLLHMQDNTCVFEGIHELLNKLNKKGIKTAVVSNKLHEAVVELCNEYFGQNIDLSKGVSEEAERKPNPVNVIRIIEEMGLSKENCIYVGDSEVDVETAHNAHIECVGVTWGFRDEAELKKSGADFIVDMPEEILKIV